MPERIGSDLNQGEWLARYGSKVRPRDCLNVETDISQLAVFVQLDAIVPGGYTATRELCEALASIAKDLVVIAPSHTPAAVDTILGITLPNIIGSTDIRFRKQSRPLFTDEKVQEFQTNMLNKYPAYKHLIQFVDAGLKVTIPQCNNPVGFQEDLQKEATEVGRGIGIPIHSALHWSPSGNYLTLVTSHEAHKMKWVLDWLQRNGLAQSCGIVSDQTVEIASAVDRLITVRPTTGWVSYKNNLDLVIEILQFICRTKQEPGGPERRYKND